jgi:preprotein translocase SecE subunit
MAVAVKNSPETTPRSRLDPLPVASLLGSLYVLLGIIVVFYGVPALWGATLGAALPAFVGAALLILVLVAVGAGWIFLGTRLVSSPPHGLRAGIFTGVVSILLIGWITWGLGVLIESYIARGTFGIILTLLIGLALLAGLVRLFFHPSVQAGLVQFEDQGWFTATAYKRSQGKQVRRWTVVGILVLTFSGIWTLHSHGTLNAYTNWELTIPFCAVTVKTAGDTDLQPGAVVDKFEFHQKNDELKANYFKVVDPGDSSFQKGQLVPKEVFQEESKKLEKSQRRPVLATPALATGTLPSVVVLPDVRFTLPLLLAVASVWLAFRVVNYPVFADFLIQTEAEMNKVSWTSRKRLVQDTIVVLVTVILLTVFLFFVDIVWFRLLSWEPIGVVKVAKERDRTEQVQPDEE